MISYRIKDFFFDTKLVMGKVDAGLRKQLSKFGAFVRTRARSSIRKRKSVAAPGMPPSSHKGTLRDKILFGYDPDRRSVVIGPTPLDGQSRGIAPNLLEEGGDTTITGKDGKAKKAHYRGNPFMLPALKAEQEKMPSLWTDSIK